MKKRIKIILKKDSSNIGKKDKIINVKRGYALNYLIPNEIAEIATKNKIKHVEMFKLIKDKKLEKYKIQEEKLEKQLNIIKKISLNKKMGENYNIFGSINEKEIIEKIFICTSIKLDKKQITIPTIKQIGIFNIEINLFHNKKYNLQLNIIPANI
uniref:50S ribosomal protein L9, chloroplastic n=1 Tax=Apoglossum ruscifolium TaxID=167976 RepID=A0A4D6WLT0_9FLOR|nr:ribosomal protein L9 [Apoglossum ruscifolium]